MIDHYLEAIDSINEVYAGRLPEIQEIENAISRARKKYLGKIALFKNTYSDPDLFFIQEAIQKAFGFYSVTFILEYNLNPNAYTSPICYNIDMAPEDHIIPYKGGYRYDKKLHYCTTICITTAAFCDSKFTDQEITGAILHEIGHNFVITKEIENPYRSFRSAYEIMKAQTGLLKLLTAIPRFVYEKMYSLKGKEASGLQWELIRSNPVLSTYYDILFKINTLTTYIARLVRVFNYELYGKQTAAKLGTIIGYSLNSFNINRNQNLVQKKAMEYLSDSFATIYGYGPDVISFLKKLELSKKNIDPGAYMPHVIIFRRILELPYLTVAYAMDSHPDTAMRLNKVLDDLKHEASKSNLDSKTKKELQIQIAKLEKIKSEMIEEAEKIPIVDRKRYIKLLWVNSLDRKRTESEEAYVSPEEIDKYYADLLKRNR